MPSALLRLRSDEQLVALFRAGSDDAFRVIHDRYRARLFAYTRQMLGGSRSDAEDALQDVFLRAHTALRQDERPIVLKAWLYRVAHNRCIDQIRRPVPAANEIFEMSRTPLPDPLEQAEQREDLRRLVEDVQRLPEQQRSALLMREMEGLSYAQLAEALETSVPAVKSLLVRARIGLVEAAEARNTACSDIRDDLALSFGKGVRSSARARKHMRECTSCRAYRKELKTVANGLSSLTPSAHPLLGLFAKLLGIGGGAGGAAAGGSAAAGGGAAVVGGGVVAGTTAKVAAVMCCAAVVGGGAVELKRHTPQSAGTAPSAKQERSSSSAKAAAAGDRGAVAITASAPARATPQTRTGAPTSKIVARKHAKTKAIARVAPIPAGEEIISPHVSEAETPSLSPVGGTEASEETGGAMAPSEAPAAQQTAQTDQTAGTTTASGTPSGTGSTGSGPTAPPPSGGSAPSEPQVVASSQGTGAPAPTGTSATGTPAPAATAASQNP